MARSASVVITYLDDKNKTSSSKVFIPPTTTIPNAVAFAQSLAQAIKNVNLAKITSVKVCFPLDLTVGTTLKAVAALGSDVQQKVLMMWDTATAGMFGKFKIPTFDETRLIANSDQVDTSDIETAALILAVQAGLATGGGTVDVTNARGMDITDLRSGREVFRNI